MSEYNRKASKMKRPYSITKGCSAMEKNVIYKFANIEIELRASAFG